MTEREPMTERESIVVVRDVRRQRRAVAYAIALFVISALAAVGATVSYFTSARPQWLGALIAVALISVGAGLTVWANGLLDDGPFSEEREQLVASASDADALDEDLGRSAEELARRTWMRRALLLAGGALAAAFVVPIRSLGPRPGRKLLHTQWGPGVRVVTAEGKLVAASDVPLDGLLTVFPEGVPGSASGQAVLVRVEPSMLHLSPRRQSWAPDGLVAYSKVCTHAGCPVGLYQAEIHQLLCPCHQSSFDVLRGARPVGGPAAWPLPQLPLAIGRDGVLEATGDFSEPVGPGWWKT